METRVRLEKIASIRMGYPVRTKVERDPNGTISIIQMKDIDKYNRLDSSDIYIVQMEDSMKKHFLAENDILFRSRGVSTTAALVPKELENSIAAAPLTVIRVKSNYSKKVDPAYLAWYINQPRTQQQLSRLAAGTSLLHINLSALTDLEVDIPPINKQKLIVEIAALSQREQQIMEELARKRQAYIEGILIKQVRNNSKI